MQNTSQRVAAHPVKPNLPKKQPQKPNQPSTPFPPITPRHQTKQRRFMMLLGGAFREMSPALALSLLDPQLTWSEAEGAAGAAAGVAVVHGDGTPFTPYDLKRLQAYSSNLVDYHLVLDLLPALAATYMSARLPATLSYSQAAILVTLGLQRRELGEVEATLGLPSNQVGGWGALSSWGVCGCAVWCGSTTTSISISRLKIQPKPPPNKPKGPGPLQQGGAQDALPPPGRQGGRDRPPPPQALGGAAAGGGGRGRRRNGRGARGGGRGGAGQAAGAV